LEDIIGWAKVMPIRPMRDLFEAEKKERELLRGSGEMLDRNLDVAVRGDRDCGL